MSKPKVVCVVPSIRPASMAEFRKAWAPLFAKHAVTLVTVWDGEAPVVDTWDCISDARRTPLQWHLVEDQSLFCRRTDACRNLGFVVAAKLGADFILTLDDDVAPISSDNLSVIGNESMEWGRYCSLFDPIQAHLDTLALRVPISWMNTAHMGSEYLRGVPYGVRDETPVMLSHGVWVGTPDFDGETQLRLEKCPAGCEGGSLYDRSPPSECIMCNGTGKRSVPSSLPYYVGPIPRGVFWAHCGMNCMIRKELLPYYYFAPMGRDSGFPDLHRMADIYLGVCLRRVCDEKGWGIYSGASTILHTRASDARKNFEQEKLGRQWNEWLWGIESGRGDSRASDDFVAYWRSWFDKRQRYERLIHSLQEKS